MATSDTMGRPIKAETPLAHLLYLAERGIEQTAPFLVALALGLFTLWAWFASRGTPLQMDELLEWAGAMAPTNREVLSYLASGVDFNPPLSHFLVRASISLLGASEWAARLPALLGMLVFFVGLYLYISRILGRSYGLLAMLLALCLPVREYALQARPYGLVLGFSALALLLYRRAVTRNPRFVSLCGLALCSAALAASHYYAVLVVGVLLAAEAFRTWKTRHPDWLLVSACAAPPLAVLWFLHAAILQQRAFLTHYFARGNLLSFKNGYEQLNLDPFVYCLALVLLFAAFALSREETGVPAWQPMSARERFAQADHLFIPYGLLLLPIIGAIATQFITHAYVPRYFLPCVLGFCICVAHLVKRMSAVLPHLLLIVLVSLGLGFAKASLQTHSRIEDALPTRAELSASSGPLLFDNSTSYLQVLHYYPSLAGSVWAITDPAAALRYRQYDTDDKIVMALARLGHGQTIALRDAVRRWPEFRIVPRTGDHLWALNCLSEAGANVAVDHPIGRSNFVFRVSVPPSSFSKIDSCEAP